MRPSGSGFLASLRQRPWLAAVLAVAMAAAVLTVILTLPGPPSRSPSPSLRDRRWQQDIAYLARELPLKHIDGVTGAGRAAWNAAAARLEAQVPQLTDGQITIGLLRLIALLRDDETFIELQWRRTYPLVASWLGNGLYLGFVPAAHRGLLGAQLEAIDGHPIREVLARLRPEVDFHPQDGGIARDAEAGYVTQPDILHWLGLTRSAASATFTVRTTAGRAENVTLAAISADPATMRGVKLARVPRTLAASNAASPYWLRVLPGRHAVYLRYNRCLSDDGFQRLALQALAIMRKNPAYRLIVDLRGNGGGDDAPFRTLIGGIRAYPAVNRHGRLFGLIDGETDSSATMDANALGTQTRALLIGQEVEDPIDKYGNDNGLLTLPHSHLDVVYTTKVLNRSGNRLATPDIVIAPTLSQVLAGADPVLSRALSYPR